MTKGVNTRLDEIEAQLDALASQLDTAIGVSNSNLLDINLGIGGLGTQIGQTNTYLADLLDLFGSNVAGPAGTLLGLLQSVRANTTSACSANIPETDDPAGCIEPFVSIAQLASEDYGGRTFASWDTGALPLGLEEGSFLDPHVTTAEISHGGIGLWKAYVLSCGSATFNINPNTTVVYPTNQWIDITFQTDMAFNVAPGSDIKVYICIPSDFSFTECVTLDSQATNYENTEPEFSLPCSAIFYDTVPAFSCADTQDGGLEEGFSDNCGILTGDLGGITIAMTAGTGVVARVEWVIAGVRDGSNVSLVTSIVTVPAGAVSLLIANVGTGGSATDSFTVEICPPAPPGP